MVYATHLWQNWGWWILLLNHRQKISLYDVRDTVIITILKELGKTDPEHGGYEATNMGHFLRVTNPQFLLCYDYSWRMLVLEWSIEWPGYNGWQSRGDKIIYNYMDNPELGLCSYGDSIQVVCTSLGDEFLTATILRVSVIGFHNISQQHWRQSASWLSLVVVKNSRTVATISQPLLQLRAQQIQWGKSQKP